jgi:Tn3 transposase DDE domain
MHQTMHLRDVFVSVSDRSGDPRADLLRGEAWEAARDAVSRALDRSTDPTVELASLQQLYAAYTEVQANLAQNTALQLMPGDLPALLLSPLADQPEPASLTQLREQVAQQLPPVELAALLREVDAFTGFARAFTHVADGQPADPDMAVSLCAVLMAQACNIGLKTMARPEVPALTLPRLAWVQQHYLRQETLTAANALLVDGQARLPLAQAWGGGEEASADGMRFVVPVRTIYARWNSKFLPGQRGVTYYNFTSD